MVFSICIKLCDHHYLIPEHFHYPQRNPVPNSSHFPYVYYVIMHISISLILFRITVLGIEISIYHSSVDGCLSCLHFLTVMHYVVINIQVQVLVWKCDIFKYIILEFIFFTFNIYTFIYIHLNIFY